MKSIRYIVLLITLSVTSLFADIPLDSFQIYVDSLLPGSKLGLSVRSVSTGKELLNIRGDEYFTPASTMKTLSTATALHWLPLDYAPETKVTLNGNLQGSTFRGVLNIRGEGDPNLSARYYKDPLHWFYAVADSIKALGIDFIQGRIDLDSSYYSGPWKPEHWRRDFYDFWYGAEVTPLQFNDNCALIRIKPGAKEGDLVQVSVLPDVGYVKVENKLVTKVAPLNKRKRKQKLKWTREIDAEKPIVRIEGEFDIDSDSTQITVPVRGAIGYFKAALLKAFEQRGIRYAEAADAPMGAKLQQFSISAAPLLSVMDEINQKSQNLHAESLFRNMAAFMTGEGNVENGKAMERKFLNEIKVDTSGFIVFDGCGLSNKNKIKPSSETQMLAAMARHAKGEYYINSFARPGIGSGGKRMMDLQETWLTKFKTGYISEVHGLAGYIFALGDTLSVALYLNETGKNKDSDCKDMMDSIWVSLVRWANAGNDSYMKMKDMWIAAQGIAGFHERLEYFSRLLLKIPYRMGPMGEGTFDSIEPKPLVYLDSVDCVTYMEHALALANAPHEDSLFSVLQRIRYFDGKISYRTRKHYLLTDWVGEGKFSHGIRIDGDTTIVRTMPKKKFFSAKKIKFDEEEPQVQINYLTLDKAKAWASAVYEGEPKVIGVAFISKLDIIDAYHTGFIVLAPGKLPMLRHASQIKKRTIELPFVEYLETAKKKALGVSFFEFVKQ